MPFRDGGYGPNLSGGTSGIHVAASFDLCSVIKLLIESEIEADLKDDMRRTLLSWAASFKHLETVKYLAERDDVEAHSQDRDGNTSLW